jgi:hypothetical protein
VQPMSERLGLGSHDRLRDYRYFRVRSVMMRAKELHDGTTQSPNFTGCPS